MIKTKRIYDAADPADGLRVLVMRLWPRGIRKDRVDLWLKELGAELGNLKAWKAGRVDWPEMRRRYLAGLKTSPAADALAELKGLAGRGTVTLLCSCEDERQCHRTILKEVLTGSATARRPPRPRTRTRSSVPAPRAAGTRRGRP